MEESAEKILRDIALKELGPERCSAVLSDNARNMKKMGRIVSGNFPHVDCAAHSLGLLTKDILQITEFEYVVRKAFDIINEIRNSHKKLALFRDAASTMGVKELVLPVKTRYIETDSY